MFIMIIITFFLAVKIAFILWVKVAIKFIIILLEKAFSYYKFNILLIKKIQVNYRTIILFKLFEI